MTTNNDPGALAAMPVGLRRTAGPPSAEQTAAGKEARRREAGHATRQEVQWPRRPRTGTEARNDHRGRRAKPAPKKPAARTKAPKNEVTQRRATLADLPAWPRLLSADAAAAYVGMSRGAFDARFAPQLHKLRIGAAPAAGRRDRRVLRYDRCELDELVDRLGDNDHRSGEYWLNQLDGTDG